MALDVKRGLDFGGISRITSLPASVAAGQPVVHEQLQSALEGIAWKDSVRVQAQVNVTIASPGAAIDGVTLTANDRVLLSSQTAQTENGVYIFNGAATPMTRALDASTFDELEAAVVPVEEGTGAGKAYRQTQVNGVIGTNNVLFTVFGGSSPVATTSTPGIAALATQAEVNAGAVTDKIVTPETLAASTFAAKKFAANIGDGSATSIAVTHNLNTRDVRVEVYRNSGNFDTVLVEVQRTSVNAVTILFDAAPASNAFRVLVLA
jgi:hypothetical protein